MSTRITYTIDAYNHITSVSDSWMAFAAANGFAALKPEKIIGTSIWSQIRDPQIQHLFNELIEKVKSSGTTISLPFRCDGPNVRRYMQLTIAQKKDDLIQFDSELVKEEYRETQNLLETQAARTDEMLLVCSWCKKVKVGEEHWLEIEDAVAELSLFEQETFPRISHGLCPKCFDNLMAELEEKEDGCEQTV